MAGRATRKKTPPPGQSVATGRVARRKKTQPQLPAHALDNSPQLDPQAPQPAQARVTRLVSPRVTAQPQAVGRPAPLRSTARPARTPRPAHQRAEQRVTTSGSSTDTEMPSQDITAHTNPTAPVTRPVSRSVGKKSNTNRIELLESTVANIAESLRDIQGLLSHQTSAGGPDITTAGTVDGCEDPSQDNISEYNLESSVSNDTLAPNLVETINNGKLNVHVSEPYLPLEFSGGLIIGASVPTHLKEKIWDKKYVDFADLINRDPGALSLGIIDTQAGPELKFKRSTKTFLSDDQWDLAFEEFMGVYLQKFPSEMTELLSYGKYVKNLRRNNYNWRLYDKEYRKSMEFNPCKWTTVRLDLQLLATKQSHTAGIDSQFKKIPIGYCFAFHASRSKCVAQSCRFKHNCPNCNSIHPLFMCNRYNHVDHRKHRHIQQGRGDHRWTSSASDNSRPTSHKPS